MKNTFLKIALLPVAFFMLTNCGNDDTVDPATSIDAIQANSIEILTGGNAKTWKISSAQLDANGTILDLSSNFNITDDEFIFSGTVENGMLNWRPGHAVNLEGTTNQETLLDYYLGPIDSSVTFNTDSGTSLTTLDGEFTFDVVDANTITGLLTTSGRQASGDLSITLTQKTQEDYASIPSAGLDFSLVTTNQAGNIFGETTAGMIGSYSDNSLYLVSRGTNPNSGIDGGEEILKYDLNTGTWTSNFYEQDQYITKRLNIINNELIVFGGHIVSTYPLNPSGPPSSEFLHNIGLTRFGFAVQGDYGYVTGNDANFETNLPAVIRKYNYLNNELIEISTLPKSRVYAGAEIINNNLFIFGGRDEFSGSLTYDELDTECFILDLTTGNFTSFNMPQPATMSFAARVENLIYVGYETRSDDDGDNIYTDDDRSIHFAIYNTLDDTFTEINHNLDDSDMQSSIHAITIFNGKLYVIYGDSSNPETASIFSAPI